MKPITAVTIVKQLNYTTETVESMVARYTENPTRETVNAIAADLGKAQRSVIAKLSSLGVYIVAKRTTKAGGPIIKKEELVTQISNKLEITTPSLLKTNKTDLEKLLKAITDWTG